MPRLGLAPHHTISAFNLSQSRFGGGTQVELILHQLPLQLPPSLREVLLQ